MTLPARPLGWEPAGFALVRAGQVGTLNIGLSSAAREHEAFFSWTTTGLGVWLHSKDFELLRTVVTFDAWMEREEAALVRR